MLSIFIVRNDTNQIESAVVAHDYDPTAENRNDWKTFEAAQEVADTLGSDYIATDAGQWTSPRYDVIKLPKIGDDVSYAFNGDSYPFGQIVNISKSLKVIVAKDGEQIKKFYRVHQTGSWQNNGTWFLTPGHISKWNPSF